MYLSYFLSNNHNMLHTNSLLLLGTMLAVINNAECKPNSAHPILTPSDVIGVEPEYLTDHWGIVDFKPVPAFFINTHDPVSQDQYISASVHQHDRPWDSYIWDRLVSLNTAPDGQVFVDVGANLGYFTLAAASLGYKVIAFEPMSRNAQKLAKSIQRNEQFASRVTLYQNAVTALSGQPVTLHETHHSNQGNGQIVVSDADIMDGILDHDDNVLHSVTLSEVLQGVNTFIVKIDVEGHENEVLEGAREWICKNVVKHIIMEISDATKLSSHPSLSTLIDFLTAAGYEMADVAVGSTVLQTHTVDALPPNVIFSLKGNTPTCLTYGSDQDTL